ncbi:hypothetical protein [Isoptericola sp. NPDC057191]|uniref:hypothetical protein n=1 Tax=Isoptericola sp. NPDC057191 TaxID=3346041 RepID=UPI0036337E53
MLLAACEGPDELSVKDAPGQTLDVVNEHVPDDASFVIQDVSPVVGVAASFDESNTDEWTLLAACADAQVIDQAATIEVSVVPSSRVTNEVRSKIEAREFGETVGDCTAPD